MVRDPNNLFLWEDWEIKNTLYNTNKALKLTNKKLEISETVKVGIAIGIFSGFFGSMLFSIFSEIFLEATLIAKMAFFLSSLILFITLLLIFSLKVKIKNRNLKEERAILHFFTPKGQEKIKELKRTGVVKNFSQMSDAEKEESFGKKWIKN